MISTKKRYIFIGFISLPFIIILFLYLLAIRIDSQYSRIINDEAESLTIIQRLTSESINNYFVLRNIMSTSDEAEKKEMIIMWHKNYNQINTYVDSLSHIEIIQILSGETLNYLVDARKEYIEKCIKFLEIINTKDMKKSSEYFKGEVEKSFFVYQNYLSNFISIHKAEVYSYNISISKQIKYIDMNYILLGLPVIYYLIAFYFICTFLYLFFLTKYILNGV